MNWRRRAAVLSDLRSLCRRWRRCWACFWCRERRLPDKQCKHWCHMKYIQCFKVWKQNEDDSLRKKKCWYEEAESLSCINSSRASRVSKTESMGIIDPCDQSWKVTSCKVQKTKLKLDIGSDFSNSLTEDKGWINAMQSVEIELFPVYHVCSALLVLNDHWLLPLGKDHVQHIHIMIIINLIQHAAFSII